MKPFNCEYTNESQIINITYQHLELFNIVQIKLLVLDSNTSNHSTGWIKISSGPFKNYLQTISLQIMY